MLLLQSYESADVSDDVGERYLPSLSLYHPF
jgi:hypothetical protein